MSTDGRAWRMRDRLMLGMISMLTLSGSAGSQTVPVIRVETHLVETTVSVHDAAGGLVPDLSKSELTIQEDGVPQTIRFFSRAEQLPLSIGLVIDASSSQSKFLKAHESDVAEFLRGVLTPEDRAFAVCFGNHIRLVSDWDRDASAILARLHSYDKGHGDFAELGPKESRDLGTALNDAVYFSVTERMADVQHRRKVLLVLSDGEENSSEHDLIDAIDAAQGADVLVYAIRYTELDHGQMNARNRYGARELDHLTSQTGGKSYDARAMKLSQAFAEIAGDLRSLYDVAFQSTNPVRDGSYRKVVIRSERPGIVLRARGGYYAR